MPGAAQNSIWISAVIFLFALLLVATPPLAVLTLPQNHPAVAPVVAPPSGGHVSALA